MTSKSREGRARVRALVFDLDGTLVDSLDDLSDAMNFVLRADGLREHGRDAYRLFIGEGARHLVHEALPERLQPETDAYLARFRARYFDNLFEKTRPYDGIVELLEHLTACGAPMAVLSNKPHEATVRIVERFFPTTPFGGVLGARADVPKKPDPTAALELARVLATEPEAAAFVGDTRTDVETALAAHMLPVGVLWGFRDRDELERAGARALCAHPAEIAALLR
jgi:phosphoglycolate phosphatase